MKMQEPRIAIKDVFAALFIGLGLILFIINLHIMTIDETGNRQDVMNTTFIIFLRVFEILLLLGMTYVIIHLLRWLVWSLNTPVWKKKQIRRKRLMVRGISR